MRSYKLILALVALSSVAAPKGCGTRAKHERDVYYQAVLQSYSKVLTIGMTRQQVEVYFREKNIAFRQMCCIDERTAYSDLVKIGEEGHPWYCGQHNVYIALQFASVERHKFLAADDSDVLKRITVFHWLEGCL